MMRIDVHGWHRKGSAAIGRFPLAFSCAATAAASLVVLVDPPPSAAVTGAAWRLFAAAALGLPLAIALKTLAERKGWAVPATIAARAAAALVAIACSFALPDGPTDFAVTRLAILFAGFFSLVTLAPFPGRGEINGFWHYNSALLSRFLLALLVTQVVAAALGLLLAGVALLAGIGVSASAYLRLWIVVSVVVGAVIFLRGVPIRPEKLQTSVGYPRWLDVLARRIVVPLVGLCVLALYAWTATFVVRADWPRGGVAGFVLGGSAAGLIAYLLVYPVREKTEGRLVPAFVRGIFPLLVPLAVLLALSVWRRIADYGVTESRYIGALAAAWLAAACAYFVAGKAKNIKAVPASIAVLAILASFGPWGATAVSARSQSARLEKLLVKNDMLSAGKVRPAPEPVPAQDEGEISRIVRYLARRGEMDRIAGWCQGAPKVATGEDAMARMGLSYDPSLRGRDIHFLASDARCLKVAGYDYSVKLSAPLRAGSETWEAPVDPPAGRKEGRYRLLLDGKAGKLFLTEGRDTVLAADIVPLVRKLRTEFRDEAGTRPVCVPREKLEIAERRGFVGIKVCLSEIVGTEREGTVRFGNVQGEVLVKTAP